MGNILREDVARNLRAHLRLDHGYRVQESETLSKMRPLHGSEHRSPSSPLTHKHSKDVVYTKEPLSD